MHMAWGAHLVPVHGPLPGPLSAQLQLPAHGGASQLPPLMPEPTVKRPPSEAQQSSESRVGPLVLAGIAVLAILGFCWACFCGGSARRMPGIEYICKEPFLGESAAEDEPLPPSVKWANLCDDLVVPVSKECSLEVPFLAQRGLTHVSAANGAPLFHACVVKEISDDSPKLVMSTRTGRLDDEGLGLRLLYFTRCYAESEEEQDSLVLHSANHEVFGRLTRLSGDSTDCLFKLVAEHGGEVIWRTAGAPFTQHVVDEEDNLLALVETKVFAKPRVVTIGPLVDVGLIVGCTLAGDWLHG